MQITACDSITVNPDGTTTCIGVHVVDYQVVTTPLNLQQGGEYFGSGFVIVAQIMLIIFGFRRIYYSLRQK